MLLPFLLVSVLAAAPRNNPTTNATPKAMLPAPPVKWSAKVGLTGFRSTIQVYGTQVILGSNGQDAHATEDPLDGVWIVDGMTGKVAAHLIVPGDDEKDTNGIAMDGDKILFGTDQGILYKSTLQGSILWKARFPGDIEAAPVLADVNRDGTLDAAFGVEGAGFYVVDGRTGATLRSFEPPMEWTPNGFLATAAAADVTGDTVPDLFTGSRDMVFYAFDGASGETLWFKTLNSAIHGAPLLVDTDRDGKPELIFSEAYSEVHVVDPRTGEEKWKATLENPTGGIEGLFADLAWHPGAACVLTGTSWWNEQEGLYCVGKDGTKWRFATDGRVTSGAVIGDVDGRGGDEIVFGTEGGSVVALDARGRLVWKWTATGPVECTPTLADIDGDGLTEVLVSDRNGTLTALDTKGKGPPTVGYHRGSPRNDGLLTFTSGR